MVGLVKRTAVRRLVVVLVTLALGWVGIGRADAIPANVHCTNPQVEGNGDDVVAVCATRQVAYEQVVAAIAYQKSIVPSRVFPDPTYAADCGNGRGACYRSTWSFLQLTRYIQQECPTGTFWDDAKKTCNVPCDPNGPALAGGYMKYTGADPGYQTCSGDCEYNNPNSNNFEGGEVDGIKYVSLAGWIPSGASCTVGPNDGYTPPSDADGDGKSDANDPSPNNPGDSGGNGPGGPNGEGDGEGEGSGNGNRSSGGGDCASRPTSSGDQIAAQIAYQTWATRCAIEGAKNGDGSLKTTVTGGTGTGTGTGGGPTQPGNGTCGDGQFNSTVCAFKDGIKKITDWIEGLGTEADGLDQDKGEEVDASDAWAEEEEQEELDAAGYGWGSSCPSPPQIDVPGGGNLDWGFLCDTAQLLGALILAAGYVQAAYIIGRA